ncbi:MAG: ABC transporter ATP-binding protein [Tumebacillaceae bacterium]
MLRLLEVRKLTGGYTPDQPVIRDITLDVQAREIVGLIGMNGAGKSTIIKHILGLLEPFSGTITVAGHALEQDPTEFRSQIAYIPEAPKLYEELTLQEHLELTAMVYRIDDATYKQRTTRLLDVFRLADKLNEFPNTFSKGMQQKVMILCAFLVQPKLFVVDEPFIGLDPLAIQSLLELFIEMKQLGCSILMSTHILGVAERYCDRFVMVNQGEIALHGTMDEMRQQAQMPQATLDDLFISVVRGSQS